MATKDEKVNKLIFSGLDPNEKIEKLKEMSASEISQTSDETLLRIYEECRENRDRFYISSNRRVGNNWDSTIEFIYEYKGRAWLCLYVQSCSSDSSTCVSYREFMGGDKYYGYCRNIDKSFSYTNEERIEVIRCILMEYVYYTYFDKGERERKKRLAEISVPMKKVFNHYWNVHHMDIAYMHFPKEYDRYCDAKKAVCDYADKHLDELYGKPNEELESIYKKIFNDTF